MANRQQYDYERNRRQAQASRREDGEYSEYGELRGKHARLDRDHGKSLHSDRQAQPIAYPFPASERHH